MAIEHIEKLRLKLVVHSGEALFHQILGFQELAGVDVIIVHRLLKNSVEADQYLLMQRGEIVMRGRGKDMAADGVRERLAI